MLWDVVIWPDLGTKVKCITPPERLWKLGIDPNRVARASCGIVEDVVELPPRVFDIGTRMNSFVFVRFGVYGVYFPLKDWQQYLEVRKRRCFGKSK